MYTSAHRGGSQQRGGDRDDDRQTTTIHSRKQRPRGTRMGEAKAKENGDGEGNRPFVSVKRSVRADRLIDQHEPPILKAESHIMFSCNRLRVCVCRSYQEGF